MRKLIIVGTVGLLGAVALAPAFSAFEAHVINVTGEIVNAMNVPILELTYGTVFPQEKLDREFDVELSQSYLDAYNAPTGVQYAAFVVDHSQGMKNNGDPVNVDRSDPIVALGAPQSSGTPYDSPVVAGSFFSLGFSPTGAQEGGWIILGFDNFIVNEAGPDMTIYEITGGSNYPDELINVEAAETSTGPWTLLASGVTRDAAVDLGPMLWAKYVRITDVSNPDSFEPTADAYDLDAVVATSREVVGGDVAYIVRQKPKCADDPVNPTEFSQVTEAEDGETFICSNPEHVVLPVLCPYLSKHEQTGDPTEEENDGPTLPDGREGINAFHGLPGPWTLTTAVATEVYGALTVPGGDIADQWNVDLRVPCYQDECAQDWSNFVRTESGDDGIDTDAYQADPINKGTVWGCDIWVEVTELNGEQ